MTEPGTVDRALSSRQIFCSAQCFSYVKNISIREAVRRVARDVKAVHGNVTALLNAGLLSKTGWDDRVSLRYHPCGFHAQGGLTLGNAGVFRRIYLDADSVNSHGFIAQRPLQRVVRHRAPVHNPLVP